MKPQDLLPAAWPFINVAVSLSNLIAHETVGDHSFRAMTAVNQCEEKAVCTCNTLRDLTI